LDWPGEKRNFFKTGRCTAIPGGMKSVSLAAAVIGISLCSSLAAPLALHPINPRYFVYEGKPLAIITSAEHYGAVVNLEFEYKKYLDTLAAEGMNNTRTFSGAYVEPMGAFNIARNTLAPAEGKFIAPWARSGTPGYANGGNKFNLQKWDTNYFARLRDFVRHAQKAGVIVEMNLFCPFYEDSQWKLSPMNAANNINGVGNVARTNVYTLDKSGGLLQVQEAMVRKIVAELNEFDNLYYEICNEPYFGGVTLAWQHRIAETIADAEKDMPKKHLISRNVANGSAKIDQPHPAISIYNFHYANPPTAVELNYDLRKVIGDNETGFRGTNNLVYRNEAWAFMLAGGGLYNNLDYSFVAGHEDGTFQYPAKQPGGGNTKFRAELRLLRDFLHSFDFIGMKPAPKTIRGGLPPGARGYVLAKAGEEYALYVGPAPEIKDEFSVRWTGSIEPRHSEEYTFATLSNDGVRLWVDGKLVIDDWTTHSAKEGQGKVKLAAGRRHDLKLEYFQSGGSAVMKLFWQSASQAKEIVPQSALFLPGGGPGLNGEYFGKKDLKQSIMNRADLTVNFDWSESSPFSVPRTAGGQREITLTLDLPAGKYGGEWLNPATGARHAVPNLESKGGPVRVSSPGYEEDIALALRRK
jgi:hypothetical protein